MEKVACFLDLHMFRLGVLISFLSGIIKVDDKSNATERAERTGKEFILGGSTVPGFISALIDQIRIFQCTQLLRHVLMWGQ